MGESPESEPESESESAVDPGSGSEPGSGGPGSREDAGPEADAGGESPPVDRQQVLELKRAIEYLHGGHVDDIGDLSKEDLGALSAYQQAIGLVEDLLDGEFRGAGHTDRARERIERSREYREQSGIDLGPEF